LYLCAHKQIHVAERGRVKLEAIRTQVDGSLTIATPPERKPQLSRASLVPGR
jgi:hypothetical protein